MGRPMRRSLLTLGREQNLIIKAAMLSEKEETFCDRPGWCIDNDSENSWFESSQG